MTVLQQPGRLLTAAEYAQLDEDSDHRWELQEGMMIRSPSPTVRHATASGALGIRLDKHVPADKVLLPRVDIDLELVPPGPLRCGSRWR